MLVYEIANRGELRIIRSFGAPFECEFNERLNLPRVSIDLFKR